MQHSLSILKKSDRAVGEIQIAGQKAAALFERSEAGRADRRRDQAAVVEIVSSVIAELDHIDKIGAAILVCCACDV